jgi:hypothetical protein
MYFISQLNGFTLNHSDFWGMTTWKSSKSQPLKLNERSNLFWLNVSNAFIMTDLHDYEIFENVALFWAQIFDLATISGHRVKPQEHKVHTHAGSCN